MSVLVFIALLVVAVAIFVLIGRVRQLERRIDLIERGREGPGPAPAEAEQELAWPAAAPASVEPSHQPPEPEIPIRHVPAAALQVEEPAAPRQIEAEEEAPTEPTEAPAVAARSFGFEELFGRRLPIWAGGATLAIAGMLIVKYSIDIGLLSPLVRVINGLLFGLALIGAAEVARRKESWMRDVRVRQALAGAGIATLYGSLLVAANVYELIGPAPALVGMAAVTALAMGLATRFGAPSALLGLVGGLAAPALVGSGEPNIPLLSLYLALAVSGLGALSRSERWSWLGILALIGGLGWGAILLLGGKLDTAATLSLGAYLMLLGILLPLLSFGGGHEARLRVGGGLVAAAQMAGLVATGGFTPLHWGLFALISIAIVWLARRDPRLWLLPPVGLAIALLLLAAWPNPPALLFAAAAGGMVLIYAVPALLALWTAGGKLIEAGQVAAAATGAFLASILHFYFRAADPEQSFALLAFGAALLPAGAAALGYRVPARRDDGRFALLVTSAAALIAAAALLALPGWSEGPAVALVAAGLLVLRIACDDGRIERSAWVFAGASILFLLVQEPSLAELARASGQDQPVRPAPAALRWAACAAVAALFAARARWSWGRASAQAAAMLLLYCACAQLAPVGLLPLVPAGILFALAAWSPRLGSGRLLPALAAAFAIVLGWAFLPLLQWSAFALETLAGDPLFVAELPALRSAVLRLLVPALFVGLSLWWARDAVGRTASRAGAIAGGVMAAVALHVFFKQVFAISDSSEFVALGLAERTMWEALLLGGAAAAWAVAAPDGPLRQAARALWCASIAHFAFYTLLLHSPLWTEQAVGPLPLINLLPLAFGLPWAGLWLLRRHEPAWLKTGARAIAVARMALALLFAFAMLRQLFHGSILVTPGVTEVEDISRSILAIALAVAFLIWGIARGNRDWRIGSLVVMLAAVAKVFLFDASGLEGLARILSFVALGFSLIGIGWLYSRYLNTDSHSN